MLMFGWFLYNNRQLKQSATKPLAHSLSLGKRTLVLFGLAMCLAKHYISNLFYSWDGHVIPLRVPRKLSLSC